MSDQLPTFDRLMNPLLRALRDLGGSGSIEEIYDRVVENESISEQILSQLHDPERSNQTEVGYRLAWARTWLKKYGLLENSARGIWSLTPKAQAVTEVDPAEVLRSVRAQYMSSSTKRQSRTEQGSKGPFEPGKNLQNLDSESEIVEDITEEEKWRSALHVTLTKKITPSQFERLVQQLLRESGFIHVEVTGRSNDGGIDGKGIARIQGLMSFPVLFQCKRYSDKAVSSSEIRDFRGSMVGRADKGLFITTSNFSPAAKKEATRDGAPPIDLLDGRELADKLHELGLGIRTELRVDEGWFTSL
jgi:restriction system protein